MPKPRTSRRPRRITSTGSPQAATEKLNTELAEQRSRLDRLEGTATSLPDKTDVALILAVDALRATLATSRSFAAELQSAAGVFRAAPAGGASSALEERAPRSGIPSLAALVYRFSLVARNVRRDEAAKRGGDPSAPAEPTGAEAALVAAEAACSRTRTWHPRSRS